jgi:hypothetical protein
VTSKSITEAILGSVYFGKPLVLEFGELFPALHAGLSGVLESIEPGFASAFFTKQIESDRGWIQRMEERRKKRGLGEVRGRFDLEAGLKRLLVVGVASVKDVERLKGRPECADFEIFHVI